MRFKIVNDLPIQFRHIMRHKKIILTAIILGLAAIFMLAIDRPAVSKRSQVNFVNSAAENAIQPVKSEPVPVVTSLPLSEMISTPRVFCHYSFLTETSTPLAERSLSIPILMYHHIDKATPTTTLPGLFHGPDIFEAQLVTLRDNCYQSIFISEAAKMISTGENIPDKPLALTFDDGYDDIYANAFPLLKKYQMKGTLYIIVNALDTPGYLTKDQVREMANSGYIEIASHTLNHANLKQSSYAKAYFEIVESKKALEKIIGRSVEDFAYPYGFFTQRDEQICQLAGYMTCASTYPGEVQTWDRRYSLYRLRPGSRIDQSLLNWLEFGGSKR